MLNRNKHRLILFNIIRDIYKNKIGAFLGFKGGTMAYFFYDLDRFSVDLDFDLLNLKKLFLVKKNLLIILQKYGEIKETIDKYFTLFYLLSYEKGHRNIKIEISKRNIISSYDTKNFYGLDVLVQKIEDAFATKILASLTRKKIAYRDYYDLFFYLKKGINPNEKIIKKVLNKNLTETLLSLKKEVESKVSNEKIIEAIGELVDESKKNFIKKSFKKELLSYLDFYLDSLKN